MPNDNVTVIARFKARDGMVEQAKETLMALIPLTRAEPGCINYDLHQDPKDPTLFLFYENWSAAHDLDRHLKTPYIQALKQNADDLFAEPIQIERWQMLE